MHPKVGNVFPGTESNFETFMSLLKQLSLTDTLIFCFRVNHILAEWKKSSAEKQQNIARLFFTPEEIERMFSGSPQIRSFDEIAITIKGPILLLMQWAVMFCDNQEGDGNTFRGAAVRQAFAKAMLISNDLWQKAIKMERMLEPVSTEKARYNLLCTFRQNAAGNHLPTQHGSLKAAKGYEMFIDPGYFPKCHPEFAKEFRVASGMSIKDYYTCLTYMAANIFDGKIDGKSFFQKQQAIDSVDADFCPTFARFLQLETQNADEIRYVLWGDMQRSDVHGFEDVPPLHDRALRARPFFITSDERIMLMDPVFFMDKMMDGPLFTLLQSGSGKAEYFFHEFGHAFEAFVHEYLKNLYPATAFSDRLSCPLLREPKGGEHEPQEITDACLDYGEEMVLFEIKATFLRQEKIIGCDNEEYVSMLRERYVMTSKGEAKGVTQLANAIARLESGEYQAAGRDFSIVKKIYPVLLVHDELVDSLMHAYFFANEFTKALKQDEILPNGFLRKGKFLIAAITLMTVEDLENLEFLIRRRGFSLKDALEKYTAMYPDRRETFHNFCGDAGYQSYATQVFAETSLNMMKKTHEKLFPKKANSMPPRK